MYYIKFLIFITVLFYFNISHSQKNELGNYRYVLLGEPTHGDGAIFDEKVNIIKQLHKENGFNIILFEAGFYDNFKALEIYKKNNSIEIYNQSVFSMWADTKAFQNMLFYVKQNPEMKILGVDCQEGEVFQQYYLNDLKILFEEEKIYFDESEYEILDKTLIYKDIEYLKDDKTEEERLLLLYDKFLNAFKKVRTNNFKNRVLEQTFKSSRSEVEYLLKQLKGEKFPIQNPRDQQMAENFMFLQKEFNDEHLILWAANYHVANDLSSINVTDITKDYINKLHIQEKELNNHNENSVQETINQIIELKDAKPMGKILKSYYKDELVSVGFTSYSGSYLGTHEVKTAIIQPPDQSIEAELFKSKRKGLIILNNYVEEKFYSSSLGYLPVLLKWKDVYDAIYFIPEMYPPVVISYEQSSTENVLQEFNIEKIKGRVLDKLTKRPIAYADIYNKSNNKSVVSNSEGNFAISKTDSKDILIVSAFGYKNDSIRVEEISSDITINLLPSEEESFLLDEIVIESKKIPSDKEILKQARLNVKNNYIQTSYNQSFYVSVHSYNEDDALIHGEEALIKIFNEKGMSSSSNPHKSIYGEILQLKNGTSNNGKDKWSGIGNLWVQLNRDIILSKANILYRTNSYDLISNDIIEYDGKSVYKIKFVNNSPGVYSTGYGYPAPESSVGTIYIDIENFAVVRYEHCLVRQLNKSKNAKYPTQTLHKIIETYKEVNGKYVLNFYKQIDKTNYFKDDKIAATRYRNFYLMSEDVETVKITKYDRPIINLKQNFKVQTENGFWENNNFYIEDQEYKYENCNTY